MALVKSFAEFHPRFGSGVFLAENATIIGDVEIGDDSSIWYGAVLRGDVGAIRIGARTSIQDLSMLHMTTGLSNTVIGNDVTVGHGVMIHGAEIRDGAIIGLGSILMDQVVVGEGAMVGAGSLLVGRLVVPPRTLVLGRPAKVVRQLTPEELEQNKVFSPRYVRLAQGLVPKERLP
ncbi:MAG: gamma carbonic anhydrase family protein [Polyangiaceae bacterium]|nr:gamma carbonic anhydrase family protein [Polyangiaceae bacterium]